MKKNLVFAFLIIQFLIIKSAYSLTNDSILSDFIRDIPTYTPGNIDVQKTFIEKNKITKEQFELVLKKFINYYLRNEPDGGFNKLHNSLCLYRYCYGDQCYDFFKEIIKGLPPNELFLRRTCFDLICLQFPPGVEKFLIEQIYTNIDLNKLSYKNKQDIKLSSNHVLLRMHIQSKQTTKENRVKPFLLSIMKNESNIHDILFFDDVLKKKYTDYKNSNQREAILSKFKNDTTKGLQEKLKNALDEIENVKHTDRTDINIIPLDQYK